MAALYDLTVLLDADAPEERRSGALSEIETLVSAGGEIVGSHTWGVRRLAFEIDHHPEAEYHLFQFRAPPETLDRIRERLKIMDGVLRHRIIRLRGEGPPPATPDRQERPRRDEREPEGRVAARAAADAPAPEDAAAADAAAADAPAADAAADEPPAVEAPAAD